MEFIEPNKKGFTIYSKSGCPNCLTIKKLIKENKFFLLEVNCDEYIVENREEFLTFIEKIAQTSCKTFPMIFYDGTFIGGANHTKEFIDKLLLSFEYNF
jgi:glutaredoxin